MKSRFVRTVYEKNGFCIYAYHTEDASVPQGARSSYYKGDGCEFTAIGNNLPANKLSEVDLHGDWEKNSHGVQFKVDYFEEIRPQSVEGIESYLASGMVKGIGPKTAKLIVEKYGTRTFEILDDYPESLLEIKGITRKKLDKILSAYQDSHAVRDLAAYLTPFKVTPKKIRKIYEHFGNAALDVVKNQPFALCEISGFGFLTVDEIARANHCRPNEPLRIEGCIGYCMELEMQNGNLYADKQKFQKQVHGQLNRGYAEEVVTEVEVYKVMYQMVHDKALYYEDGALYSAKLYHFETQAAKDLATLLVQTYMPPAGLEDLITQAQKDLLLLLSDKQVEAVKKAFTNLVSIITGGPGTGKTTVQRVLLYISEKLGEEKILSTAPTGRASRRMAESTGKSDALTLHSALGLNNDEECEAADEMLSEDFIIADELVQNTPGQGLLLLVPSLPQALHHVCTDAAVGLHHHIRHRLADQRRIQLSHGSVLHMGLHGLGHYIRHAHVEGAGNDALPAQLLRGIGEQSQPAPAAQLQQDQDTHRADDHMDGLDAGGQLDQRHGVEGEIQEAAGAHQHQHDFEPGQGIDPHMALLGRVGQKAQDNDAAHKQGQAHLGQGSGEQGHIQAVQGEKGHDHRNDDLGGAFPNAGGRFAVILTHDFVQIGLHVTAAFSSGCSIYRRCRLAFLFKDAQRERPPLGLFCYRQ